MKTLVKIPDWFCETHLRAIEELIDEGEISEAKEMVSIYRHEFLLCADCSSLNKKGFPWSA